MKLPTCPECGSVMAPLEWLKNAVWCCFPCLAFKHAPEFREKEKEDEKTENSEKEDDASMADL